VYVQKIKKSLCRTIWHSPTQQSFYGFLGVFLLAHAGILYANPLASRGADGYRHRADVKAFIEEMVAEHQYNRNNLNRWFSVVEKKQSILDAIARPAEKSKPWKEYRKIFVTPSRIKKGVEFWHNHKQTLLRAEKIYGVPADMIVSIIGVETRYGRQTGSYRVIDALSTLAFDYPPRAPFFRKELQHFLLLVREQGQDPLQLKGSYAGAMGYGQFMPLNLKYFSEYSR
jgi:membrane-bound lytic murein transglycosylase B